MNPLDAELLPVRDLVGAFLEVDPSDEGGMRVDRIAVGIPVELAAGADDDGTVALAMSPPRQPIITTVMPVFHRLHITLVTDADI